MKSRRFIVKTSVMIDDVRHSITNGSCLQPRQILSAFLFANCHTHLALAINSCSPLIPQTRLTQTPSFAGSVALGAKIGNVMFVNVCVPASLLILIVVIAVEPVIAEMGYRVCSTYIKMGEWSCRNRQNSLRFTEFL
jgi:hypothetical protein